MPFLFVTLCGCFSPVVHAHFATVGYSDITIEENTVNYVLDLDQQEVKQWLDLNSGNNIFVIDPNEPKQSGSAGWEKPQLERLISRSLTVKNDEVNGKFELADFTQVKRGDAELLRLTVNFRFDRPIQRYDIQYHFFLDDIDPKHQNFATLRSGEAVTEYVFDHGNRSMIGTAAQGGIQKKNSDWLESLSSYTWMGMKHIWEGYDHLLFLLGLVILKQPKRDYVKILSAFTAGHSITLALSALNIFSISLKFIEPLIALSIVYIAVENVWLQTPRYRWVIALLFGLVHGFGFADILQGSLGNHFVLSLLSFNLGVEIGQLTVWVVLLPLLWILAKARYYPAFARGLSGVIGCLGLFWLIQRVIT